MYTAIVVYYYSFGFFFYENILNFYLLKKINYLEIIFYLNTYLYYIRLLIKFCKQANLFLQSVLFLGINLFFFFTVLDLALFYIFFELSIIPLFFLIGFYGKHFLKINAAFYLIIYTLISSIFFLIGLYLLVKLYINIIIC